MAKLFSLRSERNGITDVVGNVWYLLLAFVTFDVVTGILCAAKNQKIKSSISFKGLVKKVSLFVLLAFLKLLDAYFMTNGTLVKMGVTIMSMTEIMSIIENFRGIGIDVSFLTKYFQDQDRKDE